MLNWVVSIVIGVVIGALAAVELGRRSARARWLAPLLSLIGAVIAAGLGSAFGHVGYGWKRAALTVVLAGVGVGVAAVLERGGATRPEKRAAS